MSIRTFKSYDEAEAHMKYSGYLITPLHMPCDYNADPDGFVWIITNPVTLNAMSEAGVLI